MYCKLVMHSHYVPHAMHIIHWMLHILLVHPLNSAFTPECAPANQLGTEPSLHQVFTLDIQSRAETIHCKLMMHSYHHIAPLVCSTCNAHHLLNTTYTAVHSLQSVLHQISLRLGIHFTIIATHKIHHMNSVEWSHINCSLHSITTCFCFILLPRNIFTWQ